MQGLVAGILGLLGGLAMATQAPRAWTRAETAKAVAADLATRLKVQEADVQVVAESDETWSDVTFGCTGRKPLHEPQPVPGFAFVLEAGGRQYVYRSDRHGTWRRCDTPKPLAPIQRGRRGGSGR